MHIRSTTVLLIVPLLVSVGASSALAAASFDFTLPPAPADTTVQTPPPQTSGVKKTPTAPTTASPAPSTAKNVPGGNTTNSAQNVPGGNTGGGNTGGAGLTNPLNSINSLPELLRAILGGVVQIGVIFLTLMIVYVGFLFVAAQGNAEKLSSARSALVWTIIGGLILLGAQAIELVIEATVQTL